MLQPRGTFNDPLTVAASLVAKELLPPASLSSALQQSKEDKVKASELVQAVSNKVKAFPEYFETFLAVLNGMPSLQVLAKLIDDEYKKLKLECKQEKLPQMDTEGCLVEGTGYHLSPNQQKKVLYLNAENLSESEKQTHLVDLEIASKSIKNEFAVLVDRTKGLLEEKKISCNDLKVLVAYSDRSYLVDVCDQSKDMCDLFMRMIKHWSFFDYEFLGSIIKRHCSELTPEFKNYESIFKEYCKHRLCEVPADVFEARAKEGCKLFVKCDHIFDKSSVGNIKEFERKLSKLLDTELHLLGIKEGCIKLVFNSTCDITTPLSTKQIEELQKMQVLQLYSYSIVYFDDTKGSTNDEADKTSDISTKETYMPKAAQTENYQLQNMRVGVNAAREEMLQKVLIQAIFHGHLKAVEEVGKTLVEYYWDIQFTKKTDFPSMRRSTGPQVLDFIVEEKRWIGIRTVSKELVALAKTHSPLMLAVETGNLEIVKMLIELDASMAFKNKDGLSALHIACNKQNTEMAWLILEKAETQHFFCDVKKWKNVELDMKSDCVVLLNAKKRRLGWTALMYSAKHGDLDTIKVLAKYDFLKLDVKNKKQHNVFHILAREPTTMKEEDGKEEEAKRLKRIEQQLKCMKYLYSLQEDSNLLLANDKKNYNILHQLCCSGNLQMLQWLLETIPELNTRDKLNQKSTLGYTPLLSACQYSKLNIVRYLTEEPMLSMVDVAACYRRREGEEEDKNGLYLAAIHDSADVAAQLIKAGCPLDEKQDLNGNTVLHVAHMRSSLLAAEVIRNACKSLSTVKNNDGKYPEEIEEDIAIPPEIKKRGYEAVKIFTEALHEGKKKIPYCSMLILGKERVGKTSLYRQLVGKKYMKDINSTRGIDNNRVHAVDKRYTVNWWEEKGDLDIGELFNDALASELAGKFRKLAGKFRKPTLKVPIPEVITEKELLQLLSRIRSDIEKAEEKTGQSQFDVMPQPVVVLLPLSSEIKPLPPPPPPPKRFRPIPSTVPEKEGKREPSPPLLVQEKDPFPPLPAQHQEERKDPSPLPSPPAQQDEPESSSEGEFTDKVSSPIFHQHPIYARMLNRRQSSHLNHVIKGKQPFAKKSLPLVLNTLDFAGQALYRPMHHCFITRRAIYIVVFKIPDMVKFINDPASIEYDPIGEIRYWVQSIHAHIYSLDVLSHYDAINRVILVGTHRGVPESLHDSIRARGIDVVPECSMEDLKKIDDKITNELILKKGSNTVKHIFPVSGCGGPCNYFFPVENSIDQVVKGKRYLKESGTQLLQDLIKVMLSWPKLLPFLEEIHPIKWLKFEERLKTKERAKMYHNDRCMIINIEDVKKLAVMSLISNPQEQDLALKFFHDTGKIIYSKCLPTLFLSVEEKTVFEGLVIIQPRMLIYVMKEIVELNLEERKSLNVSQDKIAALEGEGIADIEILEECWRDIISASHGEIVRQLCLFLQAYCLICPIRSPASATKFIIPCKLPEKRPEVPFNHATYFYFDFCHFLPEEIYHRLISWAIATANSRPGDPDNRYSSTRCIFYGLHDTNWVMELEKDKQRLKFSVVIKKNPVQYIHFIHQECLSKICDEKYLPMQGLRYYGGPEVECKEKEGGCHTNILCCVTYADGKSLEKETTKIKCLTCLKKYNINDILNPPQPPTSDSAGASLEYRVLVTCTDKMISVISTDPLTVAAILVAKELIPPAPLSSALKENEVKASEIVQAVSNRVKAFPECFETFLAVLDEAPWLQPLAKSIRDQYKKLKEKVQWTTKEQNPRPPSKENELRVVLTAIADAASKWNYLGLALGLEPHVLDDIESNQQEVMDRLQDVVKSWLKGNGGERSWKFLHQALKDKLVGRSDLAKNIEDKNIDFITI